MGGFFDYAVGLLDSDVPTNQISFAKVLPDNYADYIRTGRGLPSPVSLPRSAFHLEIGHSLLDIEPKFHFVGKKSALDFLLPRLASQSTPSTLKGKLQ